MPAPLGNQYNLALKSPELRQEVYMAFCEWIALGKSPYSFHWKKDEFKIAGRSFLTYLEKFPEELLSIHKEFADAQGYARWEQIVEDSASGVNKEANTASLQMVMRNKFDWDAKENTEKKISPEMESYLNRLMGIIPIKSNDAAPIRPKAD
jgi:hypothetical protein